MLRRHQASLAFFSFSLLLSIGCNEPRTDTADPSPTSSPALATDAWTAPELALLESLSIASLPAAPSQPSNRVADERNAAELGHRLFFDPQLSRNRRVSCATCHVPELLFTDGLATSRGIANTARNSPTLVGTAHSPWMFWDGRRDSLWAQALAPIETQAEMGSTRVAVVRRVSMEPTLADLYRRAFGSVPSPGDVSRLPERAGPFGEPEEQSSWHRMTAGDRRMVEEAFANIGKAIAAYERLLQPGESRFDRYVAGLRAGSPSEVGKTLSDEEIRGLRLFVDSGRTLCLRCHNGPLLTNQSFHRVGTATTDAGLPDFGRFLGIQSVLIDPFNCLGAFSDARPEQCGELRFLNKSHVGEEMGKFKTPTLRGLRHTGPYMHDGRFSTLAEVIEHYRSPPTSTAPLEITPLGLDEDERHALVAFLESLDGGVDAAAHWLRPPAGTPTSRRP